MGIVADIFIIIIFALNIYIGYKKGLINVAINVFAFLIAIVLSIVLFKPVSNYVINNTQIDDNIKTTIVNNFFKEHKDTKYGNEENEDTTINMNASEANSENFKENRTKEKKSLITNYMESKIENTKNEFYKQSVDKIANSISIKLVELITGLAIFISIRIVLILLKLVSSIISDLPIVKQFNEIGGVLYGILKGALIIFIILTLLFIFNSIKSGSIIETIINESYITKFLYENNIVVNHCLLNINLL